ncbi:MAG TPA: TPM domain-containing protein [Chitinophagaceae bacterium]|nr:TPM domain-containing protein [Chitinophagaceae bacterium]
MFSIFKKKPTQFFTAEEQQLVVHAVQEAEKLTSGEIRVYVESRCEYMDALDRAKEIFAKINMAATQLRNGVLVYVALKDRQLAVFADEGIYVKAGAAFWNDAVKKMLAHFNKQNYAEGIAGVVKEIGETLAFHFPYDGATDKNELPDDIAFGK